MTYATTNERIKKILGGRNTGGEKGRKFVFGAAVILLLNKELASKVLGNTAEAQKLESAFAKDGKLTEKQLHYIFRDCLRDTFSGGTHCIYEILFEFKDDIENLKDIVAMFYHNGLSNEAHSIALNNLALKILETVEDEENSLVDYCSGNGVFLCQAYTSGVARELFGEEINSFNVDIITEIKFKVLGCASYKIVVGDVLKSPSFIGHYPRVFSNFPLGLYRDKESTFISKNYDGLAKLAQEKNIRSISPDWIFINILLNSLKDTGKAVGIMAVSRLSFPNDALIREQLIKDGKIETVILFGNGVFKNTNVAAAMVVLSNGNKSVKLIDARDIVMNKGRREELSHSDIDKIEALYKDNSCKNEAILCLTGEELGSKNYSLNFSDYIDPLDGLQLPNIATLKDLVTVQRGVAFIINPNEDEEIVNYNCLLAKIGNIDDGNLHSPIEIYIDTIQDYKKYQVELGDVLLAAKGTQTKAALVTEEYPFPLLADQNILVLRPKKDKINGYYLNALLNSVLGEKILKSAQIGDMIVSISPNKIRETKIPIIPMDKQEELAKLYAVNSSEILELNKKIVLKKQERDSLIDKLFENSQS